MNAPEVTRRNPKHISRGVLKTAWRISVDPKLVGITDVNELMKKTCRLANLCYLNVPQHQMACELAIDNSAAAIEAALVHREIHGPFDID